MFCVKKVNLMFCVVSPPYAGAGLGLAAVTVGIEETQDGQNLFHVPSNLTGNFASLSWVFPYL